MTENCLSGQSSAEIFCAGRAVCPGWRKLADRAGSDCLFPEGGGQYADTGILGSARVLDVQERMV